MSEEKYNIDEYPIEEKLEEVMKLNQEQVKIIEGLQQKVEQLENIRKEAIEYIENNTLYTEEYDYDEEENLIWNGAYDYKEREDLLNILNKGSESNVKKNNTNSN